MATLQFIQAQPFKLAGSGTSIGDTTIVLQSMMGIDGSNIVTADIGSKGYGTLEPGNGTNEESITFTGITQNANGTATLTGVKTALFKSPYTETSGLAKTHAGASTLILSNEAAFYASILNYIDTAVIAGGVPATTSVNGIAKLSTAPVSAPSPIVVGDNDQRFSVSATSVALLSYPVGSIYMSTVSTNPNTLFGFGTWVAYGVGRVLISAGTGTKVATFASRASNVITVTGLTNAANNEFQTGQAVLYSAPSGAMTGLTNNTTYYIVRTGNLTFSLATSLANAQNGTVISLSSDGTGTQIFTVTLTARTGGDTGGEENHAMSSSELLAHTHSGTFIVDSSVQFWKGTNSGFTTGSAGSTGSNVAMNVMQPFITCYMWNRTA